MADPHGTAPVVRAAGVLPWRLHEGCLQVALVHRPKYDDWSWAKGKLDPGEDWAVAAVRETLEETGLLVRLGMALPAAFYQVGSAPPGAAEGVVVKQVRYWAGEVLHDSGTLEHEVDDVAWLSPTLAARRLSYRRDHDQLDALVTAHDAGELATWPLLVVRHAKALPRGGWDRRDDLRPLDAVGRRRADRLAPLLAAYGVQLVLSSPSTRCVDTVAPYTGTHPGVELVTRTGLSEEGFERAPAKALRHLERVLDEARPAALCSHGPVLPPLLTALAERAEPRARTVLRRLSQGNLDKGEALSVVLHGAGETARVVSVERHRPPRG